MIKIVLADDHVILRQGLLKLLEEQPGFHVVGETGDGLQAVEMVDKLKPDILIVDMVIPGLNGLEVIRSVRRTNSHLKIIVLSMHANEAYVVESLRYGASAYLLKESSSQELIRAINDVLAGKRYLSKDLPLLEAYVKLVGTPVVDSYDLLTERERQVLQLVAEGHTNIEIAQRLSIGARTVETHRANMQHKLGLKNQNEVVRYVMQRGLLK
jgi:DNA-binding NarL/FixJ family response regulator